MLKRVLGKTARSHEDSGAEHEAEGLGRRSIAVHVNKCGETDSDSDGDGDTDTAARAPGPAPSERHARGTRL